MANIFIIILLIFIIAVTTIKVNDVQSKNNTIISCGPEAIYDKKLTKCICPLDTKGRRRIMNPIDNTCMCPKDYPIWNEKYCDKCPVDTKFSPSKNLCYRGPKGTKKNAKSQTRVSGYQGYRVGGHPTVD